MEVDYQRISKVYYMPKVDKIIRDYIMKYGKQTMKSEDESTAQYSIDLLLDNLGDIKIMPIMQNFLDTMAEHDIDFVEIKL